MVWAAIKTKGSARRAWLALTLAALLIANASCGARSGLAPARRDAAVGDGAGDAKVPADVAGDRPYGYPDLRRINDQFLWPDVPSPMDQFVWPDVPSPADQWVFPDLPRPPDQRVIPDAPRPPDGYAPPDQFVWPDLPVGRDMWPEADTYGAGTPAGCLTDQDCFGNRCCPTPWGTRVCAIQCAP